MHPTVKTARIAGAVYLSTLPIAVYFWSYIPGKLIVRGNATATAQSILDHETLFRFSILGDLFAYVIVICMGFLLYRLLCEVERTWALLMVGFVLLSAAVGFFGALPNIAAVILFRGNDFLAVLDKPQRDALAVFFAYWRSTNDCDRAAAPTNPMKAIRYCEYGSPDVLKFEDVEKPMPKDDELLVRVRAASLNF